MLGLGSRFRRIAVLSALSTVLVGGWHGATLAAQLTLSWTAGSTDEQGYSIERAIGSTGTFAEVARPGAGTSSFVDTSVANGTTYCYRVRAFNAGGYSPYSNSACGATPQLLGLAVLKVGAGSGTVTSVPGGVSCGASCSGSYAPGTTTVLSAAAATGSTFTGWSGGGCTGTGTCSVTLNATTTVTATFALQTVGLTVVKAGAGAGTVSSTPSDINCGASCSASFPINTTVTLSASPSTGSVFAGWSGGGCSSARACTVSMSGATTVTATFNAQPSASLPLTVTKTGGGTGIVTSAPGGIDCGTTCSSSYPSGTVVTLNASASASSVFTGWSGGDCAGTGSCVTTLTAATTVTATFNGALSSFRDDFERPDSTVLGAAWTEARGDFEIRNRSLRNSTSRTRHLAIQTQLALSAGTVRAEFTSLSNNAAPAFGLVFGYVDSANYYAAYRQVGGSSLLKIVRVTNGIETVLAQRGCPNPVRGEGFGLAVSLSGNQIVFTGAGRTLSASAAAPTGKVGLMVNGGGASHTAADFEATRQ